MKKPFTDFQIVCWGNKLLKVLSIFLSVWIVILLINILHTQQTFKSQIDYLNYNNNAIRKQLIVMETNMIIKSAELKKVKDRLEKSK